MSVKTNWKIYPEQKNICIKISETLKCSHLFSQLILNRSIKNITEAQQFFESTWLNWEPLPNQNKFEELIANLIQKNHSICIYGDYDADGVTSIAIMVDILRNQGCLVDFIAPHRFNDGYGLNKKRMEEIAIKKYDALITLDCGVSNIKEIDYIKSLNPALKIIIIDHHKCPQELPNADVIINPQLAHKDHPAKNLCTAAIIDYIFRTNKTIKINTDKYLDLIAIGLIADVTPLINLNRWYVKKGLELMHQNPHPAIQELCISAKVHHKTLTSKDIGFSIAPRLNAAGRLGDPTIAVKIFLEKDAKALSKQIQELEKLNTKRKVICQEIQHDIDKQLLKEQPQINDCGIICSGQFWHMGIIGINAARLVDKYNKPAIVIGFDGELARGSARSIPNVNIYDIIKKCSESLTHYGGHTQAAGFSLHSNDIKKFKELFISNCNTSIKKNNLEKHILIDATIQLQDITLDLIEEMNKLEPFGQCNPKPVFICNANLIEAKKVGQTQTHLKCRFENNGAIIDGIGFNLANKLSEIDNQKVNIVFNISKNSFNGYTSPQIELIDIK